MAVDIQVNLSLEETSDLIYNEIVSGSITGDLINIHNIETNDGHTFEVAVYEKHYYRAGNRLTLTIVLDDMQDVTNVHIVAGGGGDGILNIDWGAADSFEDCIVNALSEYTIEEP